MMGIYQYTNKITKQKYIGQSVNLERRYNSHKNNAFNPKSSQYNTKFYRAIRKYGWNNFSYQILIQANFISKTMLNTLEIYFIDFYDSYYHGYNMNMGGNFTGRDKILTEKTSMQIIQLLQTSMPIPEIAQRFFVSNATILSINRGECWQRESIQYPIRNPNAAFQGERNGRCKIDNNIVMQIRQRFVTETLPEIYRDYKDILSFSEMKKICYGVTYTSLPIYKKRLHQWINN